MNSSLATRDNQKVQHLPHSIGSLHKACKGVFIYQAHISGESQEVPNFRQRSASDETEVQILPWRLPGVSLSKARGDACGCSPQLRCESESFFGWEPLRHPVDFKSELMGQFPDIKGLDRRRHAHDTPP